MNDLNLVVKYTVAGDSRVHVKGAARIKVDGRGGLTLYDPESGRSEQVELGQLQSLKIQALRPAWDCQPRLAIC
jgi:hypothetical protein